MAEISRSDLFAKLTPLAFKSLESATMFCKLREHGYVELTHWIFQILQCQDSDIHRLVRAFEIDSSRLARDLTQALDGLPRGASGITDLSPHLEEAVERGWLYASLLFHCSKVRTAHLIVAILKTPTLRNQLLAVSQEFAKLKIERLTDQFDTHLAGSPEEAMAADTSQSRSDARKDAPAVMGGSAALSRFSIDLTAAARTGSIDPVVGRDAEVRQVIDILMRRRQNNPILTGEAGVGKTAVVEGLALRVAAGDVPPSMQNTRLLSLDVGLLQAGASMKGEFEQRLRQVIDEVQASTQPTILFIDEAHTLLGSGTQSGSAGDAANLLKPALARGTLRTIAATTWSEYKRHIEKDPALTRRFQVVKVEQPDTEAAIRMLRHLTDILESHHRVRILDEAVRAAVELSSRYVPDRQLPDKAISLLDTAAARVAISQHAVPAKVDDCRKQIESLQVEAAIIQRELSADHTRAKDLVNLEQTMASIQGELSSLESRWETESKLVQTILNMHDELQAVRNQCHQDSPAHWQGTFVASNAQASWAAYVSDSTAAQLHNNQQSETGGVAAPYSQSASVGSGHRTAETQLSSQWTTQLDTFEPGVEVTSTSCLGEMIPAPTVEPPSVNPLSINQPPESRIQSPESLADQLLQLQFQLRELQGDEPLVLATVGEQAVASVVADWTGVPVGRMVSGQVESVLNLDKTLSSRVVGQDHAMRAIAKRVQTSRAGLDDPSKPVGVFLLAGPSGVGKTETAIALAETLYGGTQNLITINMSEFQESHTVSTLKGAPPGYVGYGEGGVLTEAVRRKPYCVVLLDEVEKAHPDTHELFFQVFDKGMMEDGEGRAIDFKNTLILLTSNVGSDVIMRACDQGRNRPDLDSLTSAVRPALLQVFPPALLGRMVVVPYYPLDDTNMTRIIDLKLNKIVARVREKYDARLTLAEDVRALISRRCTEIESGGRMIDAILTNTILPEISQRILQTIWAGRVPTTIHLSVCNDQIDYVVESAPE